MCDGRLKGKLPGSKAFGEFGERKAGEILRGEYHFLRGEEPVDAESGVVEPECDFARWVVEVVDFVLELGRVGQHSESVGEVPWYEELACVLRAQFHCHVPAESGRILAEVYRHVKHPSLRHSDEFGL